MSGHVCCPGYTFGCMLPPAVASLFMDEPSLALPFTARGEPGEVRVYATTGTDPVALGFDLVAARFHEPSFHGFPVVRAELEYSGQGYRAHFGWVQAVTRTEAGAASTSIDVMPWSIGGPSPLLTFGLLPPFFDAPANPGTDHHWVAETYLVGSPDVFRSRKLAVLAAFTWGYDLRGETPSVIAPAVLPVSQWDVRRSQLSAEFPTWTFLAASAKV